MVYEPEFYDENDEPHDDEPDWDAPDDAFDDDLNQTVPCRQCGAEIYEDAVQCPVCGWYVTADTSPWSGRPAWWVVLGLLGTIAAALALLS